MVDDGYAIPKLKYVDGARFAAISTIHVAHIDHQVSVASATLFTAFSIGTALAPNLASFFVFRILTAFQGTAFLVVGSAVIGDIYKPVRRSNISFVYDMLQCFDLS